MVLQGLLAPQGLKRLHHDIINDIERMKQIYTLYLFNQRQNNVDSSILYIYDWTLTYLYTIFEPAHKLLLLRISHKVIL